MMIAGEFHGQFCLDSVQKNISALLSQKNRMIWAINLLQRENALTAA